MSYRAIHRYARISPRKVRPVTQLISGMYVEDARHTLKGIHNRGARFVEKVLASAAANAEDRGVRQVAELRVVEARVDPGPMFKRLQPRARGMAYQIRKRFSHIHVVVDLPGAIVD